MLVADSNSKEYCAAGVKEVLEELARGEGENGALARGLLVCYTVQQNHVD